MPPPPDYHFNRLDNWVRQFIAFADSFKEKHPTFYWIVQLPLLAIATIASWLLWEFFDEGGWIVIGAIALLLLILLLVFMWDYFRARRASYQFFFKPWAMLMLMFAATCYLGARHHSQRQAIEKKAETDLTTTTNHYEKMVSDLDQITNSQFAQMSDLHGQLTEAKADRDKYQMMLAPFQAAALKIYTNEPLQGRLDLLANEVSGLSRDADLQLLINDSTNLIEADVPLGVSIVVSNAFFLTNREISMVVVNSSKYPSVKTRIDFNAEINATNLDTPGWRIQPPGSLGWPHWVYEDDSSIPHNFEWYASSIHVSTNYPSGYFRAECTLSSDNSKTRHFYMIFLVPPLNDKSVTNIIDKQ